MCCAAVLWNIWKLICFVFSGVTVQERTKQGSKDVEKTKDTSTFILAIFY